MCFDKVVKENIRNLKTGANLVGSTKVLYRSRTCIIPIVLRLSLELKQKKKKKNPASQICLSKHI